ncbi:hypothetical protein ig2599ANME_0268 [groundwater metagenome]
MKYSLDTNVILSHFKEDRFSDDTDSFFAWIKNEGHEMYISKGDKMRLSKEDTDLFYKLNWSLLFYVNKKYPIMEGIEAPDFKNKDIKKIGELHNKRFSNCIRTNGTRSEGAGG